MLEKIKNDFNQGKTNHLRAIDGLTDGQVKWLIEQVEKLKRENTKMQKVIGRYAGEFQEIIGKQQTLCREGLEVTRKMFITHYD